VKKVEKKIEKWENFMKGNEKDRFYLHLKRG